MNIQSRIVKFLLWIVSIGFTAVILGCIAIIGLFYIYSHDLPDPGKLAKYEPPIATRLYADDGKLLAEYATEHRLYLPLDSMPKDLINAFLAAEDKDFYEHDGVDFMSIARAVITNINNYGQGRAMVGGSTITQQVVKNFLLTNERSLERKVKEAILAFRMDRAFTKDRILELYLNEIYLGLRSYGVAAASLNYFNKSLEELSIPEMAFLAGLPKGPANYDPTRYYKRAMDRRAYVLGRMASNGVITPEQAIEANKTPITIRARDKSEVANADFFAEEVRRTLADKYGADVLYEGGLYVKTTVDPKLQNAADAALRATLIEYDKRHGWRGPLGRLSDMSQADEKIIEIEEQTPLFGSEKVGIIKAINGDKATLQFANNKIGSLAFSEAKWARKYVSDSIKGEAPKSLSNILNVGDIVLVEPIAKDSKPQNNSAYRLLQIPKVNGALVAMDPNSGKVLAMAGGYSYKGSKFNRATQAKRQPGSAFKPFVYLAGLESGMNPATRLLDGPISISQGPDKPAWQPKNYSGDFLGYVTMRMGLERSRNAMTVYLTSLIGIDKVQEIGERLGIYDKMPPNFSAVLGSQETTLMKLVNAYAMVINGGKRVMPQMIERIDNRYGKTIYRRDERDCTSCAFNANSPAALQISPPYLEDNRETVIDSASAFQLTYMLQGVVERGTAVRAKSLGIPLGGKTGTTNDSRDAWFVGFSPDMVVGLYIGFDTPKPLGPKETGSSVALPGFIDFMQNITASTQARPFPMPENIRLYKIDRWTGQAPYYGAPASNIIYEAFKEYENPSTPNPYAQTYESDPYFEGGYNPQTDVYSTQQAPIMPNEYGEPTEIIPQNPQPASRWDYVTDSAVRQPSPPAYEPNPQETYEQRQVRLRQQQQAEQFNEAPNNTAAPPISVEPTPVVPSYMPSQPADTDRDKPAINSTTPNYGTGGLY